MGFCDSWIFHCALLFFGVSICNFGLQIWIKYVIPKLAFKILGVSNGLGNMGTALQDTNGTHISSVTQTKCVINFAECLKLLKVEQLCSRIALTFLCCRVPVHCKVVSLTLYILLKCINKVLEVNSFVVDRTIRGRRFERGLYSLDDQL